MFEVESEKKLGRRSPWQKPIYSDEIYRLYRYIANPDVMGVFRAR
jgi:hypothetical protein